MELDSKFFDNKKLRPEVRDVLLDVYKDIRENLPDIDVAFTVLTGSLLSSYWDESSDVDFHIGINFEDDIELSKEHLRFYAKDFNNKNFNLLGRKLELYFQDAEEPHITPGIYDIALDHWVKFPEDIEVDITKQMEKAAQQYRDTVDSFITAYESEPKSRETAEKYLDGMMSFLEAIRDMRKKSLLEEGLNGFGNWVFKLLRRNGALKDLTDMILVVTDDYYDVWNVESSIISNRCVESYI